jgi:hypothetical protein
MRMDIHRLLADRSGNLLAIFALCAAIVIGAAGAGLDFMRLASERSEMQEAADAAALAAARLYGKPEEVRDAAAARIFARNLHVPTERIDLDVAYDKDFVTVNANGKMPTMLLGILGKRSLSASVSSVAARSRSAPICLLALDKSLPNGFEIYGNASLTARDCAAVSNSADDRGMRTYGGASATAAEFAVVGDFDGDFSPPPSTDIDPVADPFADLRLPASGSCGNASSRLSRTSYSLDPGVYCGGLRIMAGATVTLKPGLYVMRDGPLEAQSGATVVGDGATVAFTGKTSTLYLQGGASMKLTAPKDGDFANIALFSESNSPYVEWMTVSGGATLEIIGAMYLPTHEVWLKSPDMNKAVLAAQTSTHGLIGKRFWVQGNSTLDVVHVDPDAEENTMRLKNGARLIR